MLRQYMAEYLWYGSACSFRHLASSLSLGASFRLSASRMTSPIPAHVTVDHVIFFLRYKAIQASVDTIPLPGRSLLSRWPTGTAAVVAVQKLGGASFLSIGNCLCARTA